MQENVLLGSAIIGIVNAVKLKFPQIDGFYAIILSVAIGFIAGSFHFLGVSIEEGLITALSASGVYKLATKAGGQ